MDQHQRLEVFQAQTSNTRGLRTAMRQVHMLINAAYRRNDEPGVKALTKVYAFLYCSWAEASFSKMVHTPYGFELDEIVQVQAAKDNGISNAWKTCVTLGLRHLDATKRGSFQPNAKQRLETAIDAHVFDPSVLRNKLAHGQWIVALNRDNSSVNLEMTAKIADLDLVTIDGWIKANELLSNMIEALIESPKKAFMRDWYQVVSELDEKLKIAKSRNIAEHVRRIRGKDAKTCDSKGRRGLYYTGTRA